MATKRGKSTKGKGDKKEIADRACLAFTVINEAQTNELMALTEPEELEKKICEFLKIADVEVDIKQSAILDFYVLSFHWGKSQQFTAQQVSAIFSLCHTLLENIKEKHLSRADNTKELRKLMAGVGIENPEITGGLDFFTVDEAKQILQYLSKSLFQHYALFEYVFSKERKEEILGLDVEVETAKSASLPWPPPLDEALTEEVYTRHVKTPEPQPEETAEEQPEPEIDEQSDKEAEIISKLSPDEIRTILDSVCKEVLDGVEVEIAQTLREKEISFINRINKIHKLAET